MLQRVSAGTAFSDSEYVKGYFQNLDSNLDSARPAERLSNLSAALRSIENHQYSFKELQEILFACAKAFKKLRPDHALAPLRNSLGENMDIWESEAIEAMNESPPSHNYLMFAVRNFHHLRIRPGDQFMASWKSHFLAGLSTMPFDRITDSLFSLASLGVLPDDAFLQKTTQRMENILRAQPENVQNRYLRVSLYSLMIFDAVAKDKGIDSINFREKAQNLAARIHSPKAPQGRHQVHLASLYFGLGLDTKPFFQSSKKSREEDRLRVLFQNEARLVPNMEVIKTPEAIRSKLARDVDYAFSYNGRTILGEYDGIYHFVDGMRPDGEFGPVGYDGKTIVSTALLRVIDPNAVIIRIPYFVNNAIPPEHRPGIYSPMLACASGKKPGVYDMRKKPEGKKFALRLLESAIA